MCRLKGGWRGERGLMDVNEIGLRIIYWQPALGLAFNCCFLSL